MTFKWELYCQILRIILGKKVYRCFCFLPNCKSGSVFSWRTQALQEHVSVGLVAATILALCSCKDNLGNQKIEKYTKTKTAWNLLGNIYVHTQTSSFRRILNLLISKVNLELHLQKNQVEVKAWFLRSSLLLTIEESSQCNSRLKVSKNYMNISSEWGSFTGIKQVYCS